MAVCTSGPLKKMPKGKRNHVTSYRNNCCTLIWEGLQSHFKYNTESIFYSEKKMCHKWKTFNTVANLPRTECHSRCNTRSDCAALREIAKKKKKKKKNPRATFQTLKASPSMLKIKVHDWTIRLHKYGLLSFPGESPV